MSASSIKARRAARKKRYARNILRERSDSNRRAHEKKLTRSPMDQAIFLQRHRAAQARYREKHREDLAWKAREYRRKKGDERDRERDAELLAEFELMLADDENATFEEAARRLTQKTGRRYKL